jgi:4-amino-4-deoxy-L-arabinose transferase-like glycosyltransferase
VRRFLSSPLLLVTLTILGLLPLFIAQSRTPIPWIDEALWASTSISVIHGQPATPSVLGAFPGSGRFDLFYGPVGFKLGAAWMKTVGVSLWNWRMVSFAGGVLVIMLAGLLVWSLRGSSLVATAAAFLVAFTPPIGRRINSGRLDTITVGFEMAALILLILAIRRQGWRSYCYSALAGMGIAGGRSRHLEL